MSLFCLANITCHTFPCFIQTVHSTWAVEVSLLWFMIWGFPLILNDPSLSQGAKTGKDNGFTMLFDIESFDYSYYDEGSEGLKVALVHHLDMPIMR